MSVESYLKPPKSPTGAGSVQREAAVAQALTKTELLAERKSVAEPWGFRSTGHPKRLPRKEQKKWTRMQPPEE